MLICYGCIFIVVFSVKRMRREKGINEEVDIVNITSELSTAGEKQSEDELDPEPEVFSRTL